MTHEGSRHWQWRKALALALNDSTPLLPVSTGQANWNNCPYSPLLLKYLIAYDVSMLGVINNFFSSAYLSGHFFNCCVEILLGPCIHGCFQKRDVFFVASLQESFFQMLCVQEFICSIGGCHMCRRLALYNKLFPCVLVGGLFPAHATLSAILSKIYFSSKFL